MVAVTSGANMNFDRLRLVTVACVPKQGASVVAVTSGANMNFDRLRLVTELADVGATREAMLATTIPERPGSFAAFIGAALPDGSPLQITEFKYRCVGCVDAGVLRVTGRGQSQVAAWSRMVHIFKGTFVHTWADILQEHHPPPKEPVALTACQLLCCHMHPQP